MKMLVAVSSTPVATSSVSQGRARRAVVPSSARSGRQCVRVSASSAASASPFSHNAHQDAKSLEVTLAELGFTDARESTSAPAAIADVPSEVATTPWWQSFASRLGVIALSAVAVLFASPGYATAASSNGRAGGSAFKSSSHGPSSSFKGTPATAGPTKSPVATNSSAAAAAPAPTSSVTNNKTTVVNKTEATHHHHTTVVHAAPAPCATTAAIGAAATVASVAATAAVVSAATTPMMHAPVVAPVAAPMAAPVVAAPVSYGSSYMLAGVVLALAAVLAIVIISRRNS